MATTMRARRRQSGFSLLEVVVAFTIMALALGVLYQASGGSVRGAVAADQSLRAAMTAESLLALFDAVPPEGLSESGTSVDGFTWSVAAQLFEGLPGNAQLPGQPSNTQLQGWPLYRIEVSVRWVDRGAPREFRLASLLPERLPLPGQ